MYEEPGDILRVTRRDHNIQVWL